MEATPVWTVRGKRASAPLAHGNTQFLREGVSKETHKYTVKRAQIICLSKIIDFSAVCSEAN